MALNVIPESEESNDASPKFTLENDPSRDDESPKIAPDNESSLNNEPPKITLENEPSLADALNKLMAQSGKRPILTAYLASCKTERGEEDGDSEISVSAAPAPLASPHSKSAVATDVATEDSTTLPEAQSPTDDDIKEDAENHPEDYQRRGSMAVVRGPTIVTKIPSTLEGAKLKKHLASHP